MSQKIFKKQKDKNNSQTFMKTKIFFPSIFTFLMFFVITGTEAQNLKLGFGAGYAYIAGNNFPKQTPGKAKLPASLGLKNCLTLNTKLKYINSKFPVNLVWELIYTSAVNNINYLGYNSDLQSAPQEMQLKASQKVYSLGVGIESIIFKSFVNPYFALGILTNYFDKTKIEMFPKPDNFVESGQHVISDNFRIGITAGLGIDYLIRKNFSLDFSVKYNFMNIGGESKFSPEELEEDFNSVGVTAVIFYSL